MRHVDEGRTRMRCGGDAATVLVAGMQIKQTTRSVLVYSFAHSHHRPAVKT